MTHPRYLSDIGSFAFFNLPSPFGPTILFEYVYRENSFNKHEIYLTYKDPLSQNIYSPCSKGWACLKIIEWKSWVNGPYGSVLPAVRYAATILPNGNIILVTSEIDSIGTLTERNVDMLTEFKINNYNQPVIQIIRREIFYDRLQSRSTSFAHLDLEIDPRTSEPIILMDEIDPVSQKPTLYLVGKNLPSCTKNPKILWGCKEMSNNGKFVGTQYSEYSSIGFDLVYESGTPVAYYFGPANCDKLCSVYKSINGLIEDTQLGNFDVNYANENYRGNIIYIDGETYLDAETDGNSNTHLVIAAFKWVAPTTITNNEIHYFVYKGKNNGKCGKDKAYDYCVALDPHPLSLRPVTPIGPDMVL